MDQASLDAAYNNTAAVHDSARIVADWERRGPALAATATVDLDIRYGPRERNRLDFFRAPSARAPLLVFIHGGYWQMRAKEFFRFLAAGPLAHGIAFMNVGYTLAPETTLHGIVDEISQALDWAATNAAEYGVDPTRIHVSGWSAGGHLTALALAHPAVRSGLAISGIFDLEPIRLSYLNEKLRLTSTDVRHLSPLVNPDKAPKPLTIAYGTGELPELQRQSREYALARGQAGSPARLVALDGHNHFSILEALADPSGALTRLARDLIA